MQLKLTPIFVLLQTYAIAVSANGVGREEIAQLQVKTKQQIEECSNSVSNQRINTSSTFDFITKIFSQRYSPGCVQMGLDWYKRQLTELANSQQGLDDQTFRANLALLLSESSTFTSDLGQSQMYAEGSVIEYNTFSTGEQSNNTSYEIPVVRGYINLTGE